LINMIERAQLDGTEFVDRRFHARDAPVTEGCHMAYSDQTAGSRRIATIAGVAIIHGLLGFAFVTGMATTFVRDVTHTLTTTNVPIDVPPPPDTPPSPKQIATTSASSASSITTVIPRVPTPSASDAVFVDLAPMSSLPLPPARIEVAPPAPPPAVPSKAGGVSALGNRNAWITTDDYPPAALRAEEEGAVSITVQIGTDGRVGACTVTGSSGSVALDGATCRLYQRRARFSPARDDAGNAVAARYNDRIRWQLPR